MSGCIATYLGVLYLVIIVSVVLSLTIESNKVVFTEYQHFDEIYLEKREYESFEESINI